MPVPLPNLLLLYVEGLFINGFDCTCMVVLVDGIVRLICGLLLLHVLKNLGEICCHFLALARFLACL